MRKIYKISDLNYNDIKPEKPLPQVPEKKIRKMTRFHELTRALSPKRKSTKLLLARKSLVTKSSKNSHLRKTTIMKEIQNHSSINKKVSEDSQQNIEKFHEEKRSFNNEKKEDKNIDKIKFLKYRKILINSKKTRADSFVDSGLLLAKALKSKDSDFSTVSKIANMKAKSIEKKEKNENFMLESNSVLKYIEMPIINEVVKIEDFKEAYARVYVINQIKSFFQKFERIFYI